MKINLKLENKSRIRVILLSFLVLLVSYKSSNQWSDFPIGNDLFWWIVQVVFFIVLIQLNKLHALVPSNQNLIIVKFYLFWNLSCIVRGAFVAENYWEWKNLIATSFFLLMPLLVYLVDATQVVQHILKKWFKYGLFLYIPLSPFIWGDGVGKFLIPFSFLLLLFVLLNLKWKIIVLIVAAYVLLFDITARSNLVKFIVPFLIGSLYYFKKILSLKLLNAIRLGLLLLPILFFYLAVSGIFNVFKMDEYIKGDFSTKTNSVATSRFEAAEEESLIVDSRTFLYVEVLESALRNDYILFGRTPARGNDSQYFGEFNKLKLNTGKMERFANEVSILNIFTWLGCIGVILYFCVFWKATYLAINQSNNIFVKIIGVNVAFRWTYAWVEDFSEFDLSNIFLWLMIGMCFSVSFRKMSDSELRVWFQTIFEKKKPISKKMRTILNV